jgi:hypothetical protein
VRLHFALDHAKVSGAVAGKIQQCIDGQRQHRALHEVVRLVAKHRFGFGVFAEEAAIDQRRQILAALGGEFETVRNEIGRGGHLCFVFNTAVIFAGVIAREHREKKEQGASPALKIVSTLNFPENLDLILMDGATLLVRARAPPETWTTRLEPCGQPEPALVDHLFRLVIIFGNDCSKFEHFAK